MLPGIVHHFTALKRLKTMSSIIAPYFSSQYRKENSSFADVETCYLRIAFIVTGRFIYVYPRKIKMKNQ